MIARHVRLARSTKPIPRSPLPRRKAGRIARKKENVGKRTKPKAPKRRGRAAMILLADELFSLFIRARGRCEIGKCCGGREFPVPELQWCHGISRAYHAIRYRPDNSWSGCAACHYYYTRRAREWEGFLIRAWGQEKWEAMWAEAQPATKPDLEQLIGYLCYSPYVHDSLAQCSEKKQARLGKVIAGIRAGMEGNS